ncbi:MAG: outer membrane lipoprotein-sorting protein [Treponema sp.]|nr:outer membrane lipoprotein-sorting protein [Treponema sp.]
MKTSTIKKVASLFAATAIILSSAYAQSLSGYDVMKKSDQVPSPKTSSYKATMTLTNKKGKTRVREVTMKTKDYGDVEKNLIVFTTPKDVAGVSYLTFDYDAAGKESDSWLYMPAMKKVRRISGTSKGDDFMGTDFTYDDVGSDRDLDDYTYKLLGEENAEGFACYKVECKAKDKTVKNPRYIVWIRKDNFIMTKADFYDKQDMLQRQLVCSGIEKIEGFWTTKKMNMTNVQTGHSTLLEMTNIVFGLDLSDNLFTQGALERN